MTREELLRLRQEKDEAQAAWRLASARKDMVNVGNPGASSDVLIDLDIDAQRTLQASCRADDAYTKALKEYIAIEAQATP